MRTRVATALALAAVTVSGPGAAQDAPEAATARLAKIADEVLPALEEIRGLRQIREVRKEFLDREGLRRYLEAEIEREFPGDTLERQARAYAALGLMERGRDFRKILLDMLTDQVGGFYDPRTGRLYLIGGSRGGHEGPTGASDAEALLRMQDAMFRPFGLSSDHMVLAHELTHALQDQKFGLTGDPYETKDDDDRALAARAVVEGDAMLAMNEYVAGKFPGFREMQGMMGGAGDDAERLAAQSSPAMKRAPRFLRVQLILPYTRGLAFVTEAHRRGGFSAVDRLFRHLPRSSEQVLHPAKYFGTDGTQRDDPTVLRFGDLPAVERAGWKLLAENGIGEATARVLLEEQKTPAGAARRAAEGWDGDRYRVYERGGGAPLVVLATTWDSETDADEFLAAYADGLGRRLAGSSVAESGPRHRLLTWEEGGAGRAALVERRGRDVAAVVGGPEEALAEIREDLWAALRRGELAAAGEATWAGGHLRVPALGEGWRQVSQEEGASGVAAENEVLELRITVALGSGEARVPFGEIADAFAARLGERRPGAKLGPGEEVPVGGAPGREWRFESEGRGYRIAVGLLGGRLVAVSLSAPPDRIAHGAAAFERALRGVRVE